MVFKECHVWEVLPCSEPTCQQYTGKEMSLPFRKDAGMNCVQKFVQLGCITRVWEASEWQNRTSVLLYVYLIFDTYI